jgi:hypothetical protein
MPVRLTVQCNLPFFGLDPEYTLCLHQVWLGCQHGRHSLAVASFVVRRPDPDQALGPPGRLPKPCQIPGGAFGCLGAWVDLLLSLKDRAGDECTDYDDAVFAT